NVAKLPATTVMTKTAHTSSPISTILPGHVSGFLIWDETVSICTTEKKAASPNPLMSPPLCPPSNAHVSTVPATKTTMDSPSASNRRASSRRCRSSSVNSLDTSSRITAQSPFALRVGTTASDDASAHKWEARSQSQGEMMSRDVWFSFPNLSRRVVPKTRRSLDASYSVSPEERRRIGGRRNGKEPGHLGNLGR